MNYKFDYLSEVNKRIKDSTGSIDRVKRRCQEAELKKNNGDYDGAVSRCFQALMTMIKLIYDREGLSNPTIHNPNPQAIKRPSDADYMHRDSPFSNWLSNQQILDECHYIRTKKNIIVSHPGDSSYFATLEDAQICINKLDNILKNICQKLSDIVIRDPGDHHQPCVILLDLSGSMNGAKNTPIGKRPIDQLNEAISEFRKAVIEDDLARDRVEISIIGFSDSCEIIQSFKNADQLIMPKLSAGGMTAMNESIEEAINIIERQREIYNSNGVFFYRPWLFLFSDGVPTDKEKSDSAHRKLQNAIKNKHVIYFPTSIGDWADRQHLASYYPLDMEGNRLVLRPGKDNFKDVFKWLSDSLGKSIKNGAQREMRLPNPEGFIIERF